jgi:hypothetical protein
MLFPENGGLSPKHVGEDTASLYIYIYIYIHTYFVYALVSCIIRNLS